MPTDADGVFRNDDGQSLGDWLGLPPLDETTGQPAVINTEPLPTEQPSPILDDMAGVVADALDPFGLYHGNEQSGSTQGAIATAASNFGSSFGQYLGLAVILGVGYLIFKSEVSKPSFRKTRTRSTL